MTKKELYKKKFWSLLTMQAGSPEGFLFSEQENMWLYILMASKLSRARQVSTCSRSRYRGRPVTSLITLFHWTSAGTYELYFKWKRGENALIVIYHGTQFGIQLPRYLSLFTYSTLCSIFWAKFRIHSLCRLFFFSHGDEIPSCDNRD